MCGRHRDRAEVVQRSPVCPVTAAHAKEGFWPVMSAIRKPNANFQMVLATKALNDALSRDIDGKAVVRTERDHD